MKDQLIWHFNTISKIITSDYTLISCLNPVILHFYIEILTMLSIGGSSPASTKRIFHFSNSVNRLAKIDPAVPEPTIIKSKLSPSKINNYVLQFVKHSLDSSSELYLEEFSI